MIQTIDATNLVILSKLLIAHLLTDFVFQPDSWVEQKRKYRYKSNKLYIHALIAGLTTYILLANWSNWLVPIFISFFHYLIDLGKLTGEYYQNKKTDKKKKNHSIIVYFIIDQFAHILIILGIWLLLINNSKSVWLSIIEFFERKDIWLIFLGYIAITYPSAKLISICTAPWSKSINKDKNDSLDKAGMYIGIFERILFISFVFLNQYEAIGFLIAAKSILRFRNDEKVEPHKQTEYVLIGTFISLLLAVTIGFAIKHFIKLC